ncbi:MULTISPECIES: alpha-L-fucosidase [unclassified Paraflavitalea]|uniref:alpha-L-fucosidase n=1 Tax=unclassified Paraflavitalea TaxID=2798305 RepID=UPI003D334A6B
MKRILFVILLFLGKFSLAQDSLTYKITPGKYKAIWESFIAQYQCPEWFQDAKFGIWAHWSAQCVPEAGDWYARHMYIQGYGQNKFHVKNYGHPSEFGFMEFDNLWKAENWDPEKLMALYKKAGAKYFVALANHHDNFDAYNSKYHPWNSVNVGPKKDIVGIWEKLARKNGLYFGVSNHSAHAWHWLQSAYGYDAEGPKAGVRYDAAVLTKADGKGKWWEGLDPQDLYTGPTIKMPDGITTIDSLQKWHEANTRPWNEFAPPTNLKFVNNWYLRCQDLVQQYKPDLVYFDNFGLPLGQTGVDVVADIYNQDLKNHAGKTNVVVTAKYLQGNQNKGVVEDFERGYTESIKPFPWQTCTCIGDWHYNRDVYNRKGYKSVKQVVHQLIDIVSKNGNLLLSIPVRGDGSIDELELAFLEDLAKWMQVNGTAIFGTRPWKVFGEGPTVIKEGMFNENDVKFTNKDIRYTKKGATTYAFILGKPEEKAVLTMLGTKAGTKPTVIKSVRLLGYNKSLKWKQTNAGLEVIWPVDAMEEVAYVLEVK